MLKKEHVFKACLQDRLRVSDIKAFKACHKSISYCTPALNSTSALIPLEAASSLPRVCEVLVFFFWDSSLLCFPKIILIFDIGPLMGLVVNCAGIFFWICGLTTLTHHNHML